MEKRHQIQEKILGLIESNDLRGLSLRQIAEKIGEDSSQPQKINHHLTQLKEKGLIYWDKGKKIIRRTISGKVESSGLVSIPILGAANCGPATLFAKQSMEGYLKISKRFLSSSKTKGIFAVRAVGSSLNKADIDHKGTSITDGDFILIDGDQRTPRNNDYVLSVIDDVVNIKKYIFDKEKNQIILLSESTENIPPIYIHPSDTYSINGKVIQVIKKPKID